MKKIIKEIWILAILLSALPSWAYDFSVNGIYYGKNSDGKTVYVTSRSDKYSGSVVIPSTVTYSGTTYSVTSIGSWAFKYCSGLTSVTIPNSVTEIVNDVFNNCTGLKQLVIQDGTSTLSLGFNSSNKGLFYDAPLESVYLGRNLTYKSSYDYGYSPFYGKSTIKELTIGNSVTSIGEKAFYNCSGLTSVTIPNSVTSIGNDAFYKCIGLKSVTIPNSVTSIGHYAFQYCSGLTSVTIGNSVTSIGESAFKGCSGLTRVTIGNSVTEIGVDAFYGTAWYDNQPDGLVYAGQVAYKYKGTMPDNTSITIKDGTLGIAEEAFKDCSGLTSVTIGNSVTSIGNYAFSGCSKLTLVTIPNSVTKIGNYAFYDCYRLTWVTIGKSVSSIGDYAFFNCNLKKVTSLAALPPTIMENTFSQSVSIDSTLYVYENSEVYYREDEFWQNFCKIETLSEEPVQLSVLLPGRGKVAIAVPYNETVTLTVLPNDVAGFVLKSATFNGVEIIDELDENYQYTTPVLTEDAVLSVMYINVDGGIDQSLANRIKVSASNGTVRVYGAAPESEVLVCDLSGKIVCKSAEKTFTLGEGIYVLNVEGLSFKFAM